MAKRDERDFAYMHVVTGFRAFIADDGRPGLHLKRNDGETLDVVFSARAIRALQRSLAALQQRLDARR